MLIRRGAAVLALLMVAALFPAIPANAGSTDWSKRLVGDFTAAWQVTTGKGATVAVLSSGVDTGNPFLTGTIKPEKDFVDGGGKPKIEGTLIAALIASSGPTPQSPFGLRGMAASASILPVRVFPDWPESKQFFAGPDSTSIFAKGIRYAADQGADVIVTDEYSWGNASNQTMVGSAVSYAISKGSVVVSSNDVPYDSSGKKHEGQPVFPAAFPGVIGVGAVGTDGAWDKGFSTADSSVLVAGPGTGSPSALSAYDVTVAQCAVAATAALIRAEHPKMAPVLVARAIAESAHHPSGGYNTQVGFGIINPAAALKAATALTGRQVFTAATHGSVSDRTHFSGTAPTDIVAVKHNPWLLAGFGGLLGTGVLGLLLAVFLAVRLRRRPSPTPAPAPEPGPEAAVELGSVPESAGGG